VSPFFGNASLLTKGLSIHTYSTNGFLQQLQRHLWMFGYDTLEAPRAQGKAPRRLSSHNICRPRLTVQERHLTKELTGSKSGQNSSICSNLYRAIRYEIEANACLAFAYNDITALILEFLE
jgi:hypothetical protein